MKNYYAKRISVILAIFMLLSSFPMVSASEYVSPDNVTYLDASFATQGVEDWYAWTWSDNSGGRWVQGTEVTAGVFAFNYLDSNVVFARADKTKTVDWNNGSVYNQTEDLFNHTADYFYVITAWKSDTSNKMQGKWEFVGPNIPPTDPSTEKTVTVEPPTTDSTEPTYVDARASLDYTIRNIKNSIPVGGTPYTKESQKRFNEALKNAENLLNDSSATDSQLREAEQELKDAFNGLEYSTANRENLWAAIEQLRVVIESGQYQSLPNGDTLKDDYDYAMPVYYYEPEQSVIDEWEAKILSDLKTAGIITEPTTDTTEPTDTTASQPTIPTSESTTGYTEPTATTEDPTSHCTEHDLPYSPEFGVALANYSNGLVGSALSLGDIDIFYFDDTVVVFGLSDNLCTEGEEDVDGYHFENWNFFPREANKTGYCVYKNGTVYNLPDAVNNNILSARALASIIPHSSMIDQSTTSSNPIGTVPSYPTEPTENTQPTGVTEPYSTDGTYGTEPTTPYVTTSPSQPMTTEDPTGHCTDWEQEQLKMQFATELVKYSNELGYSEPLSIDQVTPYTEDFRMYVFALYDNLCTESEEIINGYKFINPNFCGNPKNTSGYCVYNGTKIYSIADAVKERVVTVECLASILPYTEKVDETAATASTQESQSPTTEPTNPSEPTTEATAPTETTEPSTTPTQPATYSITGAKVTPIPARTYTGKAITPTIKVTYNGKILSKNKDYTLSYQDNKNAGTAKIIITGKGSYTGTKAVSFKILKAANTMTVKTAAKTVKYSKVKSAKQTVSAITVTKAVGKVTYKKSFGSACLTVSSNGKITVKKGTKKGSYTIRVKVSAAGSKNYKSKSKTVTVTIKVI